MGFSEHKITAFANRVADLADQPNLPPQELKARFDACPEELRMAHNAVCDEGKALSARIDAYRAQTFEGEITRDMLTPEVQAELSGKADKTALTAEQNARLSLASSNTAAHKSLQTETAKKCEIYVGSYTGDDESSQYINLGFVPLAVIVFSQSGVIDNSGTTYGGVATADTTRSSYLRLEGSGFRVYKNGTWMNNRGLISCYIAFK